MLRILKQPLLHFLLLGTLIFLVYREPVASAGLTESVSEGEVIRVDRRALLDYMQYQAKAFEANLFGDRLDAMSEEERQLLIADYVREEALYREALNMHMEEGDYIIKQRLVQKVEFLLENLVGDSIVPSEEELAAFYQQHLSDYVVEPVYSFTHIFFDAERAGADAARARAESHLMQHKEVAFDEAGQYGDRFPFLQNYVERTRSFVENNFGAEFVKAVEAVEPSKVQWYGPIGSRYGYHLVMLINRTAAVTPPLTDIRDRVIDDFRYEAIIRNREQAEQEVIAGYEVQVDLSEAQ